MNMQEALLTAIEFEKRVRLVYQEVVDGLQDPAGRAIFDVLAKEEQYHVDYLTKKLNELKNNGSITQEAVNTFVPAPGQIEAGIGRLKARMSSLNPADDLQMLTKALDVEREASRYYRNLLSQLPADGQAFFQRFVEIEEGHVAIVEAEIDHLEKSGFWFDFRETDLED